MKRNLNENSLIMIIEHCHYLKTLSLRNLKFIGNGTISAISIYLKDLEALDLSDCNIRGESLFKLRNCNKIKKLLLKNLSISDNELFYLIKDLNPLITLSLSGIKFDFKKGALYFLMKF